MMRLSRDELEFFNENGYIILRNFTKKRVCKQILDIALVHLKYRVEPIESEQSYHKHSKEYRRDVVDYSSDSGHKKDTVRRLRQVYHRDIIFKNWMESRKIRAILEQILEDTPTLTLAHHNSIMTKMPKSSTETAWHQDIRYWNFESDNLVSVWLALDKEVSENGVLEFIPKSHKMKFKKRQFDKKEYFKDRYKRNIDLLSTRVSTSLNRGDVVIFHSKLLHRANKNITDRAKISFVYTVKGLSNRAVEKSRSAQYPEIIL